MGFHRSKSVISNVLFVAVAFGAGGCGLSTAQKAGIATFGHATTDVAAVSALQFPRYRERTIEMNRLSWALDRKGKKLKETKPDGTPADAAYYAQQLAFDEGLAPEHIAVRLAATNVLAAYGDALVTLSGDSEADQLQKSSQKLVSSLEAYPKNPLKREQMEELGKVVQIAGNVWIEWKKRRAIERIVPIGVDLVDGLCNDLAVDFDRNKQGIAMFVANAQGKLEKNSLYWLRETPPKNPADRTLPIDAYELSADTSSELTIMSTKGVEAVVALRKANKQLADLVANRQYSIEDIKQLAKTTQELVAALRAFVG